MFKYRFKILTRNRIVVDKLLIAGESFENVKNKLEKMYPHCEIIEHQLQATINNKASFDEILDLITKSE